MAALDLEEKLFSERQACISCGVNIPALEPRSFSFNSKYGACPECDGIGVKMVLNPGKVIPDPGMPIGSIQFPIENQKVTSYLRESLLTVARNFKCDGSTPFEQLPAKAQQAYFFGSSEPLTYSYDRYRYTAEFPGIAAWLAGVALG